MFRQQLISQILGLSKLMRLAVLSPISWIFFCLVGTVGQAEQPNYLAEGQVPNLESIVNPNVALYNNCITRKCMKGPCYPIVAFD
eukprot:1147595-Pelagomonas_calceolata.AAC.13